MTLNYGNDDMNHMMDWSLNGWIYLILGGILFLLIIIILLYFLSRNHHQESLSDTLHHETSDTDEYSKIQTQNYQDISSFEEKEEKSDITAYFCPNCGEKLDERSLKYCPFCGSKI